MARKCEEDTVPETKANFVECNVSNGPNPATVKAVVGSTGSVTTGLLPKAVGSPGDRIIGAVSPKLDDDADDILSMSLNKIDSPPPTRPVSRSKIGPALAGSNSNSSSSSSGCVEDLVRRKSNALSKVQSKSDSPLDGASVGNGSGVAKSTTAGAAGTDMDGVDLCSTDEVKVFKDEGDRDDEKLSVEHNLLEEKSSLIDFTENEGKLLKAQNPRYHVSAEDPHPTRSKIPIEDKRGGEATLSSVLASHHAAAAAANPFNMGYPFVSPYPTYSNGDPISMPMANKIGIPPFFCYSTNSSEPSHSLATHHLTTPPPAHCGIPPYQLDAKGIAGLSGRGSAAAALYAFGPPNPHQYHPSPYSMLGANLGNNWHTPSVYSSLVDAAASAGFRNSNYPPPPHDFSSFRFSHLISPQSSAASAAASIAASSVANHSAHPGYVGAFPHQIPPSYSLAGLTAPSSPSLVNSGPKQSVSTSSSKSNNKHRYFPSISALGGDQGASQASPTSGQQSKNGGGSSEQAQRVKDAKLMSSSSGSPFGRDLKGSKQQHVLDNTSIGIQGLNKDVGADLSSNGVNRLNSALLYQPYDAISKELGVGIGGVSHAASGEKGTSNNLGSSGLIGNSGSGSMMSDDQSRDSTGHGSRRPPQQNKPSKPHIKKPLNAFMLYMKDMRANVVAECTLKESAAINQILGRRWHSLSREEQSKYYEKARMERQLHMELYPGWSARDNYGYGSKKKKRKKDRGSPSDISSGNNMKKCRARYGLDQQNQWCKPCRRKKKCIKYMEMLMMSGGNAGGVGGAGNGGGSLSGTMSPDYGNDFENHNEDDDDDDDDGSGEDSDEHMDDMDDDMMPPSNEMGGGGAGGGSGVGGGGSGAPNGGPGPFLVQGPQRSNDPDQQTEKIFGNPAAQACAVGVATIKQERDFGKAFETQTTMHASASVASYNAMLMDHRHQSQQHQHHQGNLLQPGHILNGSNSNPSSPASMLGQQQQQQISGVGNVNSNHNQQHHTATTTVGPHSQEDKHGMHGMYPFQNKHQAAVCFPPSPAASSSSSLTAPLSNNPKLNSSHSLWMASSPMLMTPATLSGSDQSPQRQTPEETTKSKTGGLYGDHHGLSAPSSVEPPAQLKKKKRRRKRKHGSKGGMSGARNGAGPGGMSKSIQHILLRAIFEGNSGQVNHGDKENVIEFIEHFFRTRHSNHRMRQLIQARMNCSSGVEGRQHNGKSIGSRQSDSDGGETDSSSCSDEESEEMAGCPRSSSKLPFTISSIIG